MTAETQSPAQDTVEPAAKSAASDSPVPAKAEPATAAAPAKKAVTRKPAPRKTTASKTTRPSKTAAPKTAKPKKVAKPKPAKAAAPKAQTASKTTAKPTASAFSQDYSKELKTMYESSMKQMQDLMSEFKGGFADLPLANEEMSKVLEASRDATISGMSELNKELNEFTQARMTECWETTREVLSSKSMPEALEVQSKYFQDAMKAYTDELQKLNSIATDVTQKAFAPMNNGFADSFTKMFTGKPL